MAEITGRCSVCGRTTVATPERFASGTAYCSSHCEIDDLTRSWGGVPGARTSTPEGTVMSKRDDGGPAFSRPATLAPDGTTEWGMEPGMSLRDWFAGQMLAAIGRSPNRPTEAGQETHWWMKIAGDCYAMADAMIAARSAT